MKIRLEIVLDNGTSKETEIIGPPTSESISYLINKLLALNTSSSNQSGVSSVPTQQPQIEHIQSPQPIRQEPPGIREIQNFNITEEKYDRLKNESLTIKERLEFFLSFEYRDQWFTSLEVQKDYSRIYGSIHLSTVSTYLSRMCTEGKLEKKGNRNQRKYHIIKMVEEQEYPPATVWKQHIHM
jgi:hypothetical protein